MVIERNEGEMSLKVKINMARTCYTAMKEFAQERSYYTKRGKMIK